nr:UDP-N-acetylglucosamine 1-carboxyvinyltransferase [uncultured Desulfobacter sp.]
MENSHQDIAYLIQPSRLAGEVHVSGAKNSVLRLLAASLLTKETIVLNNYPQHLLDAQVHVRMLEALGKRCEVSDDQIIIKEPNKIKTELVWEGRSIRNTLLILGALTARNGEGAVPLPGGCKLGERKYDLHEMLLIKLGATVWAKGEYLFASAPKGLKGTDIHLPIRSTGATENAIICGTLAQGTTRIWNPHIRPEILDLIKFLSSMGASIKVYGQEHIEVTGKDGLAGTTYSVLPDNMEALTWMVAATITGGSIEIQNFPFKDLEVPLIHLKESGTRFFKGKNSMIVRGGKCYPLEISTGPFPGINSDMQPLLAVYGAFAKGQSVIVDLRFPGRYAYVNELEKMGLEYAIKGNLLRIKGHGSLYGANVRALDLRAGIALALAGLGAESGETLIQDAWQIERGYNAFVEKIKALGGNISYG